MWHGGKRIMVILPALLCLSSRPAAAELKFNLPVQVGSIVEQSLQPGDKPLVFLVQDLHCDYQVQSKISDILKWIQMNQAAYGQPDQELVVAVEGAAGEMPVQAWYLQENSREKNARLLSLVKKGTLTGADYFTLMNDEPVQYFGAETETLYRQGQEMIAAFFTAKNKDKIADINRFWLKISKKELNANAYLINYLYYQYVSNALAPTSVLAELERVVLKQHETELWNRLLQPTSGKDTSERLEYIFAKLFEHTLSKPEEKQFFATQDYFFKVEQMLWLSISSSRAQELVQDVDAARAIKMQMAFVALQQYQAKFGHADLRANESLQASLQQMIGFYRLNGQRDQALAANTLAFLQSRRHTLAALVVGGYHAQPIAQIFRQLGINYVVIRPAVPRVLADNPYYDLLLAQAKTAGIKK